MPNNNEIRWTGKADFDKIYISRLGHQYTYPYFPEDTINVVSFREVLSINYRNLIKIVGAVFKKIAILFLATHFKSTYFWS